MYFLDNVKIHIYLYIAIFYSGSNDNRMCVFVVYRAHGHVAWAYRHGQKTPPRQASIVHGETVIYIPNECCTSLDYGEA